MTTPNADDQSPLDEAPDMSADAEEPVVRQVIAPQYAPQAAPRVAPQAASKMAPRAAAAPRVSSADPRAQVRPSCKEGCGCGGGGGEGKCSCGGGGGGGADNRPPLVYALGTISYDFGSQARFDSLAAEMSAAGGPASVGPIPASIDTGTLLEHLAANPHVAESITWTLNLDATPLYAIRPDGAFAAATYERLRKFLADQVDGNVRAERVSIPGYVVGTTTLLTGQKVGVVLPELRGMFNWTIGALVAKVMGKKPDEKASKGDRDAYNKKEEGITNFLQRVYSEVRNLGLEPRDRALNFAATNAFQLERVFTQVATAGLQLDQIDVEKSPVCRLDSDCWDVVLYFFNPMNVLGEARRAYRFTVDVSDVVPVLIGDIREWAVR